MRKKRLLVCCTVVFVLIVILVSFFVNFVTGKPGEKAKIENKVKQYVENSYGLSVINTKTSFSIDGLCSVLVSIKNLPFEFDVFVKRRNLEVYGDMYLERLIEYNIEEIIRKRINLSDGEDVRVILYNKFSAKDTVLTVNDVKTNPDRILEISDITYSCSIEGVRIESGRSFIIFKEIVDKFSPTSISFHYREKNKQKSIYVNEKEFESIHSENDLMRMVQ